MKDKGTNVFSSLRVERTGLTLSAKCFRIVETQPMCIPYYQYLYFKLLLAFGNTIYDFITPKV